MSTLTRLDAPQVLRAVYDEASESLQVTITSAMVELDNDQFLLGRNAADDDDVELIKADASDNVQIGSAANASTINLISSTNITGDLGLTGGDVDITGSIALSGLLQANGTTQLNANIQVEGTVTPALTVGAQEINKMCGTVNFAAAASTLVVTNSRVTTSSLVICTIRTVDATATAVTSVVPAAGSFTITLNAGATAETSVGFLVINPS
jgi:hypothetical protein